MNIELTDKMTNGACGLMTPEQADAALSGMSKEAVEKFRMRELLTDPEERRRLCTLVKSTAITE